MTANLKALPTLRFRGRPIFYGWAVVAAAFISDFLSYGIGTVAFTVFFNPMSASLGWSRGLLSSAIVLNRLVEAVATPLLGPIVDRRGPQAVMVLGAATLSGGTFALGLVEAPWQFYAAYGLVMAVGMTGLGSMVSHTVVSKWFVQYRGRALSAVTMGYSLAGIILPLPATFLILTFGWRTAWMVLGVVILALGLLAAAASRRQPEDYGLHPDGLLKEAIGAKDSPAFSSPALAEDERWFTARQAARTPAFWLLVVGSNLGIMALYGINIHLVPYLNDRGYSPAIAATIYTVLYGMQFLAKPLWGFISERLHVRYCAAMCYFGGGLGLALLIAVPTLAGIALFTAIYGLTRGAQSLVISLAWADYFGRTSLGAIRGLSAPFGLAASAAGPVVAGVLFDVVGSYQIAFAVFVVAFWAGAALVFLAQPPKTPDRHPQVLGEVA